jgi:hypothetical protein
VTVLTAGTFCGKTVTFAGTHREFIFEIANFSLKSSRTDNWLGTARDMRILRSQPNQLCDRTVSSCATHSSTSTILIIFEEQR